MKNCRDCNIVITGNFCSNCGLPIEPKRIDRNYIVEEISSVLNFDKGFFYTVRELVLRPGDTAKSYIEGDRKKIVKPIFFLIICSLMYTIGKGFFSYDTGIIQYGISEGEEIPIIFKIFDWFSQNYGYANILMATFIAMWIKFFFRKYNYNYYEIYILLCFVMGVSVLVYTLLGIIESLIGFQVLNFGVFVALIYSSWAIGQFFDRKKKFNYLKSLLSYLLGFLTSFIIVVVIGNGLDNLFN